MMMCKGDVLCRDVALVDDTSTVNNTSDGETFATEPSIPHETDSTLMGSERTVSEHSRLLTDDDGPESMWGHHRQVHQQQHQHVNAASAAPAPAPSAPHGHGNILADDDQASWSRTLDGFTDFSRGTDSSGHINYSFSSSMYNQNVNGSSNLNDGYAFEMFGETQTMIKNMGTKIGEAVQELFREEPTKRNQKNDLAGNVLGALQGSIGVMNDHLDNLLIQIFNVPSAEVEVGPSYTMYSLNESTLTDSLIGDRRAREIGISTRMENAAPPSHTPPDETFLIPMSESAEPKSYHSLQYSYSDAVKDDFLDEVLHKNLNKEMETKTASPAKEESAPGYGETDSDDSVRRFKEELYRGLGIDIHQMDDTNKFSKPREDRQTPPSRTRRVEEKVECRDDDPGQATDNTRKTQPNKKLQQQAEQPNQVVNLADGLRGLFGGNSAEKRNDVPTDTHYTPSPSSFSAMHNKRVLDLLNKNLPSTNRSGVIDLSDIGTSETGVGRREFVPVGKTGLPEYEPTRTTHCFAEGEEQEMTTMSPREEFEAMMKRLNLPKFQPYPCKSVYGGEPETIDLTMYEEPL